MADEKKEGATPRITSVSPLEIIPGSEQTVRIRGAGLDSATEIRFVNAPDIVATVKEKKKADVPDGLDAKIVGDTQVEAFVKVPAEIPCGTATLIVLTPSGQTAPKTIRVCSQDSIQDEKEPNNGFHEAQPISRDKVMRGAIGSEKDVDTFSFQGRAGETVKIALQAARLGSLLDGMLTLFDPKGNLIRMRDDVDGSRDPELVERLPSDGLYYVVVQDAQDRGTPWHCYELTVSSAENNQR